MHSASCKGSDIQHKLVLSSIIAICKEHKSKGIVGKLGQMLQSWLNLWKI